MNCTSNSLESLSLVLFAGFDELPTVACGEPASRGLVEFVGVEAFLERGPRGVLSNFGVCVDGAVGFFVGLGEIDESARLGLKVGVVVGLFVGFGGSDEPAKFGLKLGVVGSFVGFCMFDESARLWFDFGVSDSLFVSFNVSDESARLELKVGVAVGLFV